MLSSGAAVLLGLIVVVQMLKTTMATNCPLDLSGSNFTLVASVCSNQEDIGKCCRYINALISVSVSRYANATSNLGVPSDLAEVCLQSVSETFELYGVPPNATVFCGVGTKIPFNYECKDYTTVLQMVQSPKFTNVSKNCMMPLSMENNCRRCLNAGLLYLRRLVGADTNTSFSTCRDATFVALASKGDNVSALDTASCFFGVQGLSIPQVVTSESPPLIAPEASPSPLSAASPNQLLLGIGSKKRQHPYRLTLIPAIGIVVTVFSVLVLFIMILLIRKKSRELEDSTIPDGTSWKAFPLPIRKCQEGPSSMFRKFSYKETKRATDNFSTIIGQGGFGTVYKAQFSGCFVAAVKRMDKVSEQAEEEFCREMELLGRLHHRHLVALRGFCAEKHERFLIYEYMENGSLKDHLHCPGRTPLSWRTRIQIAVDVANALEYLHFYCDPPLCHRDIKSSNILLDENFVAKVADFGLAHASRSGTISFEPVNTDIRGTPGYMDPEYVVTQELTEKSDIYSYGVLLLELVTSRRAIQDNRNLVEWSQTYMETEDRLPELVDPLLKEAFDTKQLKTLVTVGRWCTEREGRSRPSIKQVLRLLYETSDPMHSGFVQSVENEDYECTEGGERIGKGKIHRSEVIYHSGDARCLPSSSSTSRSYCSRSFLLETSSPQSV
ncbi:Receptor-like protein kinase [Thalictrum thalictroides]|uniref:Receptor-like protein kinase n=1 Tax=Thalictrum thalictroides TaxID=46969 RepID=A0A7J6X4H6_THATH|nr:Receptor-like protein kinase [Thalictrum thalictroides]